ncbi:circadian clock protein LdpA [Microseira wollei]|uniref:4Fe-4S ferredoxin, iron-sulfur binding protein n=1 Tax=Microseira wollei NIES-4236 TaxID=2530354 RepID=A0AAV3XSS4_9CYAN|nr:LdpA C-terminal domain-containing domain [Microseira wollei]GET42957.1 4Fe-4S ferredoxin, iron-sulfur binding protein [Microseira wollei NIES-4236]
MTNLHFPLHSLREGHWFKLICGASFQHLPAVRNLTLAYTLAGADCIDVAADPAVIAAAQAALQVAGELASEAQRRGFGFKSLPWLMVSLNDGEDPHFRKAEFNPTLCPADCPRPCEKICPADAIRLTPRYANAFHLPGNNSGVIDSRCYGCGRCIPVCPYDLIYTRSYVSTPDAIAKQVVPTGIDAVEIHTQVGRKADFERLWRAIAPNLHRLKLIAVSCPDGEGLIEYLRSLYELMEPLPIPLVWQTDGRPMSGDIGAGTTHAAIKLGQKVLSAGLPGYVQLAGGTNSHTVIKLKAVGLLNPSLGNGKEDTGTRGWGDGGNFPVTSDSPMPVPCPMPDAYIAGVAYGSYARVLLSPVLDLLEKTAMNEDCLSPPDNQTAMNARLEDNRDLLWQAVAYAHSLVSQLKLPQVSSNLPL